MQTEELSSQAQPSSAGSASEEEKFTPSADEALKEIKEATGAKNMEVGMWLWLLSDSSLSHALPLSFSYMPSSLGDSAAFHLAEGDASALLEAGGGK